MRLASGLGLALLTLGSSSAPGQQPAATAPPAATASIGTYQIDRYEAIRQLESALQAEPNNVANLIILGELAHEIAVELPAEQDQKYYALSRSAYERALALEPTNAGLQAAVAFAKEQAANAPKFDAQRRAGVAAYLASRRQELGQQPGASPRVRVYEPANPNPPPVPNRSTPAPVPAPAAATTAGASPVYRPFFSGQGQPAYTYGQYSQSTLPSVSSTAANMTPRVGASNPATTGGAVKPAAAAAPP